MECMVLDLETFGTNSNSVIVQIGACMFDSNTGEILEEFSVNVSADSCLEKGLTVTEDTIFFWMYQPEEVKNSLISPEPVDIVAALEAFTKFCEKNNPQRVWCHPSFDAANLESAYKACGLKSPIKYFSVRDLRTIVEIADLDLEEYIETEGEGSMPHSALADCYFQVNYLVDGFLKIREGSVLTELKKEIEIEGLDEEISIQLARRVIKKIKDDEKLAGRINKKSKEEPVEEEEVIDEEG